MERYIGLDAHASSCTLAVAGPSGKRLGSHVVETNARALIEVLRQVPRNRHVCLEEGTLSGWLYEVLEPHVEEVGGGGGHRGSREPGSEERQGGRVRAGGATPDRSTRDPGLQGARQVRAAGPRARAYGFVVRDVVRVKNRLKSVLRSRGVGYGAGSSVYAKRERERWLEELPKATRPLAELLYEEHDVLAA